MASTTIEFDALDETRIKFAGGVIYIAKTNEGLVITTRTGNECDDLEIRLNEDTGAIWLITSPLDRIDVASLVKPWREKQSILNMMNAFRRKTTDKRD